MLMAVQEKTEHMKKELASLLQTQGENSPLAQLRGMISPITSCLFSIMLYKLFGKNVTVFIVIILLFAYTKPIFYFHSVNF